VDDRDVVKLPTSAQKQTTGYESRGIRVGRSLPESPDAIAASLAYRAAILAIRYVAAADFGVSKKEGVAK
jgi:hypothetical protein